MQKRTIIMGFVISVFALLLFVPNNFWTKADTNNGSNGGILYEKIECPEEQRGGLVPCGRNCDDPDTEINEQAPCTFCHFLVLFKRIVDFLTTVIAFPVLVLMIIIGGIMFLTSSGNEKQLNKAKEILKAAFIGVVIILCAWLVIDTVITVLTPIDSPIQGWNEIECPVP